MSENLDLADFGFEPDQYIPEVGSLLAQAETEVGCSEVVYEGAPAVGIVGGISELGSLKSVVPDLEK